MPLLALRDANRPQIGRAVAEPRAPERPKRGCEGGEHPEQAIAGAGLVVRLAGSAGAPRAQRPELLVRQPVRSINWG